MNRTVDGDVVAVEVIELAVISLFLLSSVIAGGR